MDGDRKWLVNVTARKLNLFHLIAHAVLLLFLYKSKNSCFKLLELSFPSKMDWGYYKVTELRSKD